MLYKTHQGFKGFPSRKNVKNSNFFEKNENFHEYRWYHHSEARNRKPMSRRTFLDHKTFWIWKNFKMDFWILCYFSLRIWKTAKKCPNLFFVEISRAPEYSTGPQNFFLNYIFDEEQFYFLLFGDWIKIGENRRQSYPPKKTFWGRVLTQEIISVMSQTV